MPAPKTRYEALNFNQDMQKGQEMEPFDSELIARAEEFPLKK